MMRMVVGGVEVEAGTIVVRQQDATGMTKEVMKMVVGAGEVEDAEMMTKEVMKMVVGGVEVAAMMTRGDRGTETGASGRSLHGSAAQQRLRRQRKSRQKKRRRHPR